LCPSSWVETKADFLNRVCTSKRAFRSNAAAKKWLRERSGRAFGIFHERETKKTRPYECVRCNQWHLTSQAPLNMPPRYVPDGNMRKALGNEQFERLRHMPGFPALTIDTEHGPRNVYNPADVIAWAEAMCERTG
jgi:hypothetical protein